MLYLEEKFFYTASLHSVMGFVFSSSSGRVIQYYLLRCIANYDLLEKFNLIGRTSEFARLYGILFYSVLSRGTQVYYTQSNMIG